MELRAGYKRTEVGVIPEDWSISNLQSVCAETITYGIVQCGPHVQNGVPYIRVSDMNSERLDVSEMLRTAPALAAQFSRSRVSEGDIVYALRGKIGEVRRVNADVAGANLTQGTAKLCPSSRLDSIYLLWSLRSQRALRQGDLAAKGSTFREITLAALRQIQLPVPPITEQRAIATALSDMDASLAKIDQLIAKKRDLKQAAMQQLLTGQTRLPGFNGEWEMKRLGDVLERIVGGGTPSRSNSGYWGGEIPWVTVKDFATFDANQAQESITFEGLKSSASNLIPKGTLITSTRMALGRAVIYGVDVTINQDLKALFPKRFLNTKFLYYWFEQNAETIDDLGSGSTVKGISLRDLRAIPFHLASLAEQTAIAAVLSDMDAELTTLEARRDKTRALKQGMMQALLTGRIRLVGVN